MSDGETTATAEHEAGRDYGTVGLVCACVVAVVLAATLLPALSAAGSGTPAESLIPVPPGAAGTSGNGQGQVQGGSGGGGGLGALDAGSRQSVGGSIGDGSASAFRSQNAETHFTVTSERPSYWRTGAYDTYTGGGWRRSAPSDTSAPMPGESVGYEVELAQAAGSPPTVWQPETVDGPRGLSVSGGLATAENSLPSGTTYSGESRIPPDDPAVLAASGRDYPAAIEQRYTELPAETAAAVRPLTSGIVSNASNSYETAVQIESYLERTKDYSLNVSAPDEDVARQFLFEMESGYCEYFATTMTAMLRSQGIPARYVVGYSTGEAVGEDTYRVRALNAHAWVEVFFAGVGWVRFDPTPASERIAQERQSLQSADATDSYDPPDTDNRGSETDGEDSTPTATSPGADESVPTPAQPQTPPGQTPTPVTPSAGGDGSAEHDVSLNRTAVPGAAVEVRVTADGAPVSGAQISFNGESIGETDGDGTVVGTVPYDTSLDVTVTGGLRVDESETPAGAAVPSFGPPRVDASPLAPPGAETAELSRHDAVAAQQANTTRKANTTRTFTVETNATLAVSGELRTGSRVTVTATVGGVPVRNAAVTVDGERVARTDDRGRAQVRLPEAPGNVTLRVERGAVAAERTLRLDALAATVSPTLPLPVAFTPVEVSATLGGESAAGLPVTIAGERVGETGVNGSLTATLPLGSSVPVAVESGGQTAGATVSNPLINLLAVLLVALSVTVAGVVTAVRRDGGVRSLPAAVAGALFRASRALVRLLVGIAVAAAGAITVASNRLRTTLDLLRAVATGERRPAAVARALRDWIGAVPERVATAAAALPGRLPGGFGHASDGTGKKAADAPRVTIREGWARFVEQVSMPDVTTRTPGQVAAHAIAEDDLPVEAVTTLRDEFRAVEYGPRTPDEAAPRVASAVEAIETTAASRTEVESDATSGGAVDSSGDGPSATEGDE